jgi:N-methylhydantoinase B/oxoprolinase/acetone carboxylase alpha subunit
VKAAVAKWGVDTVVEGQQALIGYAETRARALIDRLPEGAWQFP